MPSTRAVGSVSLSWRSRSLPPDRRLPRAQLDVGILTSVFSPSPVPAGSNLTFTTTVNNPGPGNAANVSLTYALPTFPLPSPRATFVSIVSPAGWSCVTPPVGTVVGNVTCSIASMPAGSVNFMLVVNVDPASAVNGVLATTITLAAMDDPDLSNNIDFETPLVSAPIAVTLRSFTAAPARSGVSLRWRTASELQVAGFNVYRERGGRRVRLNAKLIPAANGTGGHVYTFVDRKAPRSGLSRYWLQAVNLDGTRRWYGPAIARRTM